MKKYILIISAIICVLLLSLPVYLFMEIYPKAPPIRVPEISEISMVSLKSGEENVEYILNEYWYDYLIERIKQAKPTHRSAMDDYPTARPYYCVEIQTDEMQYRYFLYQGEDRQAYLEMSYEGVYRTREDLYRFIIQFFVETVL